MCTIQLNKYKLFNYLTQYYCNLVAFISKLFTNKSILESIICKKNQNFLQAYLENKNKKYLVFGKP